MGIENFFGFFITAVFFTMTPGIDTAFVLNKSIGQGRKSGIYATFGINSGVLTHTLFAALGLSVIIANSEYALIIIKFSGAIYLIYLGFVKFRNREGFLPNETKIKVTKRKKNDFWSGFLTNTLNPKVALFFLAFFPQFINPTQIENPLPFMVLGVTYASIGVLWYLLLTLFASAFSQKINNKPRVGYWLNKLSGIVFIIIGIKIALA
jgi:threonine/homoserine/homoserine lactone efflux protein